MKDKKYYVDFGPELLQLLGPNLYTNIYYVLGEIIANAYDADAENVYIIYNSAKNSITIEDDGNGMSYDEINDKFLPIGVQTRTNEFNTYTPVKKRKKMGRKGIGKLAALSVSDRIKVISQKDGDKSGCVLSLDISQKNNDGKYEIPSIDTTDICFHHIKDGENGSAIIMENSRYSIHKSIESAKRNISLIFPFACKEFKIHLEDMLTNKTTVIDDSVSDIINLSDSLITFCNTDSKYYTYLSSFHDIFNDNRYYDSIKKALDPQQLPAKKELKKQQPAIVKQIELTNNDGNSKIYDLKIEGWIATYASTRDKKKDSDFPSNHISLISNDKLGQFDILPDISTDRMQEAYVVGQFYVDLLENTELPDIAASNRQGYKEDDERVVQTKELIKTRALNAVLSLKVDATKEKNYLKNREKEKRTIEDKNKFDESIRRIVNNPKIKEAFQDSPDIKKSLEDIYDLKNSLKEKYKKVMISHASEDKPVIDELEKILHFCGFSKNEILYTSSNNYESGYPNAYTDIYDYLHDFFVDTVMKPDICVIYVLSSNFASKWPPILEAGAGWILDNKKFPMFTDTSESIKPPFKGNEYTPCLKFGITEKQAHYLANAIKMICERCNKLEKTEQQIFTFIESKKLVNYK